jgi:multidrug efflux pump subunit AcrA (membrane-fusion protein)
MKYSGEVKLRNNSYVTVTVDARDSGQAKSLISQQYGIREQDIVNFYERQDLYHRELYAERRAREEANRQADEERRDREKRERQERLDREIAERRHRELLEATKSQSEKSTLEKALPYAAAAAAGYLAGRASAPEPEVVVVEPKRDWDDFSDVYEKQDRERLQAEQEQAYDREQEERDQEDYEAERAHRRAEFEAKLEAKEAASRKFSQYLHWIIPLFNALTPAEKAYATAYLDSLGNVFKNFFSPKDILAELEGISNPDAVGTLVEKVEGSYVRFRFIDNDGGPAGYCVNDNSPIRKEILAYGFDLETYRLSQNEKRLRRQAGCNDHVLNLAYKVIRETLDKLWEPVKADELSLSAQIQAYETLLTKLAAVSIDVDAIFPWGTFAKVPFAFNCAEDEAAEREAVMRSLTEKINQLFQRERQPWIEDATHKLDNLKAEQASKPKSIWERLFPG